MEIYDNKTGKRSALNVFTKYTQKPKHLYFASPFFTYDAVVTEALRAGSELRLIIGLNTATSVTALRNVFSENNAQVRYFSTSKFHSKLYVFGTEYALTGSANLTGGGLSGNQEICIGIRPTDGDQFDELFSVFQSYWQEAMPLTEESLKIFEQLQKNAPKHQEQDFERKVVDALGKIEASGLFVGDKKKAESKLYLEAYQRTYQEFLRAFAKVREVYIEDGRRKVDEGMLPLRIEIDQFFNFVREYHAKGECYREQELLTGALLIDNIKKYVSEWHEAEWPFLVENTVPGYQKLKSAIGDADKVKYIDPDAVFDALRCCYSFLEQRRHFAGGEVTFRTEFLAANKSSDIRKCLQHLLYSSGDHIERMADCIFNAEYKLKWFGRSGVQELMGWLNDSDFPIFNNRTGKVLRYLGFSMTGY